MSCREFYHNKFSLNFSDKWAKIVTDTNEFVAVRGETWINGYLLKGEELARTLLTKALVPENGNYAYVVVNNDNLFATVDRVRSIPLFYGYADKIFYISDNARWIREKMNDGFPDSLSIQEFLYAGFVTGRDTLFPKVKQLQAGEYVKVQSNANGFEIKPNRYYTYRGKDFFENSINELIPILDKTFIRAFERLIQSANGRTLVIPLSGGLDSRLVITMLKRLGYEKVITFSYGKEGNKESVKSQEIAARIGYPWVFIPYAGSRWRNWYNSKEFGSYRKYADGLSSLPHIQDWPAVGELKKKQLIPKDAIFVPGHTGDFISGGHIPPMYLDCREMDKEKLVESIIKKHYRVNNFREASKEIQDKIIHRIKDRLPLDPITNIRDAGYIFEFFDWQERQAKFIINSLRVYEFWGYSWHIPLWDMEIMSFWQRIPFEYKISKKLYKDYLNKMNFSGVFSDINSGNRRRFMLIPRKSWMFKISSNLYHKLRNHAQRYKKRYLDYFLHEHQYFPIFSYSYVAFKNGWFQNINSFLVRCHIDKLKKELLDDEIYQEVD